MTQTELLYTDPLAAAEKAAAEIASKSGVAHHDVALVMGSGWVSAVDALGLLSLNATLKSSLDFSHQLLRDIRARSVLMKLKAMERSYVL